MHAKIRFENLAIRRNGQILTITTSPNASVSQVDPLGIVPATLVYTVPNVTSAMGIVEGKTPDVFYFASGTINIMEPLLARPETYSITELEMRGVTIFSNGTLTNEPRAKRIATIAGALLPHGIEFASPDSDHLLIADSFRGRSGTSTSATVMSASP